MNEIKLKIPQGIQYISEWENYNIPKGHVIIDKGVTGCGYTEYCLTNKDNIVLCSPRKLLLENKRDQHTGDLNIFYAENTIEDFQGTKTLKDKIRNHIFNCQGPFGNIPFKIMVTYDSCHYVVEVLQELGLLKDVICVVDEFQSIFLDSYYKSEVELDFVEVLQDCANVVYLSATPMLKKYLLRMDEFKDLDFYQLDWSETGYVETIRVQRRNAKSLGEECGKIIEKYLKNDFPVSLNLQGKPVESREIVFYFNSVTEIVRLVKGHGLTPKNTLILCSDTPENQKKLKRIGFQVGKVPLRCQKNPMFTFCTSAVYIGVDFYSTCASTIVFANPNIENLALDVSLDLPQIVGRQRDKSNPFKNDVTIFYKTNKKKMTREDFDLAQEQRRESTKNLLEGFSVLSGIQKSEYLWKIKADIQVSQYSRDFISISKNTNLPVYNSLIEIANERAWEVSQEDYQDSINVTKSIEKQGFNVDLYLSSEETITQDFLDNYFYRTGVFEEKMKMYCEFRDQYKDNSDILEILDHKILDPKYKNYYEYFGTSRCKAKGYKEIFLYREWKDVSKEDKLQEIIYSKFKEGDRITKKSAKEELAKIYSSLDITKTPKATDLENFFELMYTKITMPDKKTKDGFKLIKKLL